MSVDLSDPALVMERLTAIEDDLALRQNTYESAAQRWYGAKREIEREQAVALLNSEAKSVTEKKAHGVLAAYDVEDAASEAEYQALKVVVGVLETRASICQSILKAQGRIS